MVEMTGDWRRNADDRDRDRQHGTLSLSLSLSIDIPALLVDGRGLDGEAGDSWTTKRNRSQKPSVTYEEVVEVGSWKLECKIRWVRQDV